jgi:cytochrome c oxidase subunit 4
MTNGETHSVTALQRVLAFVALVVLATISLLVGTALRGAGAVVISLAIAVIKTGIVLWFFMDLVEQPFRSRLAIAVAALLVILLVSLSSADVATRLVMPRGPSPEPSEGFFIR